ncbi:peptide ABC transporter substrate-binding protein [Candidatus Parcubacteria bacterium]|nr:MAG: peptide ABC transporter substrate-binding protein [Candidatus Parcubacteria bacterium]
MFANLKHIYDSFSPKERRFFVGAGTIGVISAIVLTALWVEGSTRVVAAEGGEFIEGVIGQPAYVNPLLATTEADKNLARLVFSSLTSLAEKVEASKDGRTWKVRLKERLTWHDGEKLTSDDVIFTVQKIQDPETQSPLAVAWQGVLATRLSELELQFVLANPYAFFSYNLDSLYVVPKHLLDDVAPPNWRLSEFNLQPVGSGAYAFASYKARSDGFVETYRLAANPLYHNGRPFISEIVFRFFSQSEDLVKEFNAGRVDGLAGLPVSDLKQVERPHAMLSFQLPRYYAVFLNQSKNLALKELEVRRALTFATDTSRILADILQNRGAEVMSPIPSGAPYAISKDRGESFSPELAKETLEGAGWKFVEEKGYREKAIKSSTIPLELNLVVPQIGFLVQTANELRSMWERVGFKINVIAQSPEEVTNTIIKNRDYEMLLFGNILGPSSDLFSFWHSSERFFPGLNLSIYSNKKVDSLIVSTRQNLAPDNRHEQFEELQSTIIADYPAVFLYSPDYLYLVPKGLQGIEAQHIAEPADRFRDASLWYLKTARAFKS